MLQFALDMPPADISYVLFLAKIWFPDICLSTLLTLPLLHAYYRKISFSQRVLRVLLRIYTGILAIVFPFILLTLSGYFRLYETPFGFNAIRSEFTVIYKELFTSFIAELRPGDMLFFLSSLMLIFNGGRWVGRVTSIPYRVTKISIVVLAVVAILSGMMNTFAPSVARHIDPEKEKLISSALVGFPMPGKIKDEFQANKIQASFQRYFKPGFPLRSPYASIYYTGINDIPRGKKYNIIFYYFESLTRKRMFAKYKGKPVAPNLLKFRENSLEATRHYANFPLSINAFFSSYCSAYALPDGKWIPVVLPDIKVSCISQLLKRQGYATGLLHAGYLEYAAQDKFLKSRDLDIMLNAPQLKRKPYQEGLGPWGAADERAMIKPMLDFLEKSGEKPFFLALFPFNPHHPYFTGINYPELVPPGERRGTHRERSLLQYYNSLNFADYALGQIIDALEKTNKMHDTLIFIFGDHGEAFYEHPGNFNHPFYIYEENIHVPFLIFNKKLFPGRKEISRISSHIDLVPTVLDILALPTDTWHEGKSMLKGGSARFAEIHGKWNKEQNAIRDERYKYIREPGLGTEWLFDLHKDPEEKKNLKDLYPDIVRTYREISDRAKGYKIQYYQKIAKYPATNE